MLERTIDEQLTFAFETTLGGKTITALLERAAAAGHEVRVWYAGLATPEAHIARVRARVAKGGHDIPEERIVSRFDSGRLNLVRLLPHLTELRVFDNSAEADPLNCPAAHGLPWRCATRARFGVIVRGPLARSRAAEGAYQICLECGSSRERARTCYGYAR